MKLLHDNGYTEEEKIAYREVIFSNLIQSIKVLLEAMDRLSIPLGLVDNEKHKKYILEIPFQLEGQGLPVQMAVAIKDLWNDSGLQACYARSNEYQLNDSAN